MRLLVVLFCLGLFSCGSRAAPPVRGLSAPLAAGVEKAVATAVRDSAAAGKDRYLVIPERIRFARGYAWIEPESAPLLDAMAGELRRHPDLSRVTIEGHTDGIGSERVNRWLSEARARAVKEALVARGVPADVLVVAAYAATQPVMIEKDNDAASVNRRVQLRIGTRPAL